MAAFRESYNKLYEFRSLAPNTPIIALTATATRLTRDTIVSVLQMESFFEISESPNKLNITYAVQYMEKEVDHEEYFVWLTDELKAKQQSCERTIVYCQTIKQCGIIYGIVKGLLGKERMFNSDGHALVEMLHSCTPEANKKSILESFQDYHGSIRLLVATIAFGMGIDCKGVCKVLHYGPSKNIEAYVQETGRAGRGGEQSIAFVLYHGILLNHVDSDIKSFLKTGDCRRMALLKHFEEESAETVELLHLCCDNCASKCKCGMADCSTVKYPMPQYNNNVQRFSKERNVTAQDRKHVEKALMQYHKSLVVKLLSTSANGDVKTLTNLQFMLGFSELQISQVLENLTTLFTMSDVYKSVEVWDRRHAQKILAVISSVFCDVSSDINSNIVAQEENYDFDDELMDELNELLHDDELFEMIIDNMSLSQLESSLLEEQQSDVYDSTDDEMPSDVLAAIEDI